MSAIQEPIPITPECLFHHLIKRQLWKTLKPRLKVEAAVDVKKPPRYRNLLRKQENKEIVTALAEGAETSTSLTGMAHMEKRPGKWEGKSQAIQPFSWAQCPKGREALSWF
ncbi:hypothetical protein CIHG_07194 [Coccidioides immitis H538.4]|uniref:Uncharacterized protein n=3 Tax=Coccidioides immitis TaxID=5501 RepID=A0A0J8R9Z4_COCIT|nr:hypothetical protein CIRG_09097 [Coccidioides immitis RMSCC 2394]KMU81245.1 hypothetical protein CISG_02622 [Coccidioides immitis RMSCC 3703]KMU89388.1 hypothetical protein CIHG_07194 [Coccidioides immitis H538.4]